MGFRDVNFDREQRRHEAHMRLGTLCGFLLFLCFCALVTAGDAFSDTLFWLDAKLGGALPYMLAVGLWGLLVILFALGLCRAAAAGDRLADDARTRYMQERAARDALRTQHNVVALPERDLAEVIDFPTERGA